MKVSVITPQGKVSAQVDEGFIGEASVSPDGTVLFAFFPAGIHENGQPGESDEATLEG